LKRTRVQEIADQNARLVAEKRIRGLLTAPKARIVDDVVMKQRSRVDELDDRGRGNVIRLRTAAGAGRK
jgi:hypothetical protein